MKMRSFAALACLGLLVACGQTGGNPLVNDTTSDPTAEPTTDPTPSPGDEGDPINSTAELPPGTAEPTISGAIYRVEPRDAGGNGYANSFKYDPDADTFFVDGLAFDGDQPDGVEYSRSTPAIAPGTPRTSLGMKFALYEAPASLNDPLTGKPIDQFEHRALYGVSNSGQTEFAIVRTGGYIGYGFGGFVYQRNGGVVLPAEGQAIYSGEYAGIRDSNASTDLAYVSGDAEIKIDFKGFRNNCEGDVCADAVRGTISNRKIYDTDGTELTAEYVAALEAQGGLPDLQFRIGPNVMTENGEIIGEVGSQYTKVGGDPVDWENGTYYAVMSGDHTTLPGGEIVGIIVVEGGVPFLNGVPNKDGSAITMRETGGFIVVR